MYVYVMMSGTMGGPAFTIELVRRLPARTRIYLLFYKVLIPYFSRVVWYQNLVWILYSRLVVCIIFMHTVL